MAKKTTISKMDAVRQAMSALGNAATRTEIQKFVKERFGVDMNLDVVSSYKAFIAKNAKKPAATTPKATPAVQQPAAATKKGRKKRKSRNASSCQGSPSGVKNNTSMKATISSHTIPP